MLRDVAPKGNTRSTSRARALRRSLTLPEVILWQGLRARPAGLKFRRQHPSGPYILDFFCSDARLAIEIDGAVHDGGIRQACDQVRDGWFDRAAIMTLRVSATKVLRNDMLVIDGIIAVARARLPLHHPASLDGPPPRAKLGED